MSVFAKVFDNSADLVRGPGRCAKTLAWATATFALFSYAQAYALSLGELQVTSRLGQPFDAVVRLTGATGENLHARCFSLADSSDSALPQVTDVRLTLSNRLSPAALQIRGVRPMREPMSELVVKVECPGIPRFQRTFMVLLDPPADTALRSTPNAATANDPRQTARADTTSTSVAYAAPAAPRPTASASPRVEPRRQYRGPNDPVQPGSPYRVRAGDVLSMIASRVVGRGKQSVWPLADRIVAENPDAFIDGNPDLLIVGARLFIPDPLAVGAANSSATLAALAAARLNAGSDGGRSGTADASTSAALPAVGQVSVAPAIRSTPPLSAMILARRLGAVSRERLTLRREGRLQVTTSATGTTPEAPPAPLPSSPEPAIPAPAQASPALRNTPQPVQVTRRDSWFGWLGLAFGLLLGALASAMGLRNWARRKADERVQELIRAQRHQSRLDQSRKKRPSDEEPAIVVQEDATSASTPVSTPGATKSLFAIDPMALPTPPPEDGSDEIVVPAQAAGAAAADAAAAVAATAVAGSDGLQLEDTAELTGAFEAPDEFDLELLARDYAQSSPDIRKLEPNIEDTAPMLPHEELGLSDGTQIMDNALDLELPEDIGGTSAAPESDEDEDDPFGPNTLEQEMLALDYGLEESGASAPGSAASKDGDRSDRSSTASAGLDSPLTLEELDDNGDVRDRVGEQAHGQSVAHSKDEDYYHLEASSIVDVGELTFDAEGGEDESKILEFRKRPGKTGTNDASGDD